MPNASPFPSDRAGGNLISGTFGFRAGIQTPRYALKVALRPGFVSYDRAYLTSPTGIHLGSLTGPVIIPPVSATPEIGRITHFVTSLSINADYALTRHFACAPHLAIHPCDTRRIITTVLLDEGLHLIFPSFLQTFTPRMKIGITRWALFSASDFYVPVPLTFRISPRQ